MSQSGDMILLAVIDQQKRRAISNLGKGASRMYQCLHCEINEPLESRQQNHEVNLAEVAIKV